MRRSALACAAGLAALLAAGCSSPARPETEADGAAPARAAALLAERGEALAEVEGSLAHVDELLGMIAAEREPLPGTDYAVLARARTGAGALRADLAAARAAAGEPAALAAAARALRARADDLLALIASSQGPPGAEAPGRAAQN